MLDSSKTKTKQIKNIKQRESLKIYGYALNVFKRRLETKTKKQKQIKKHRTKGKLKNTWLRPYCLQKKIKKLKPLSSEED